MAIRPGGLGGDRATMQAMGKDVAFWAERTPMKDTGWSTHRSLARLFGSRTSDEFVEIP